MNKTSLLIFDADANAAAWSECTLRQYSRTGNRTIVVLLVCNQKDLDYSINLLTDTFLIHLKLERQKTEKKLRMSLFGT